MQATDTACTLSAADAPSGKVTFSVTNGGAMVTEFYLLATDGLRIVGEVENIGPGLTRDLVLAAAPGSYFTACKPGMVGDGIRAPFAVSDSGADLTPQGDDKALVDEANRNYQAYVKDQTEQLVTKTQEFVDLYKAEKGRRGSRPVPAGPGALGADRDRRRVLRRSRSRRWTSARPTSSPARSSPAGTGSRRTCGRPAPRTTSHWTPRVARSTPTT